MRLDAYERTRDRSPRGDLRGFSVADIDLPEQPGDWLAVAIVELGSGCAAGQVTIPGDGMCAPLVDELMVAAERVGGDRANFIHLEVYPSATPTGPPRSTRPGARGACRGR